MTSSPERGRWRRGLRGCGWLYGSSGTSVRGRDLDTNQKNWHKYHFERKKNCPRKHEKNVLKLNSQSIVYCSIGDTSLRDFYIMTLDSSSPGFEISLKAKPKATILIRTTLHIKHFCLKRFHCCFNVLSSIEFLEYFTENM